VFLISHGLLLLKQDYFIGRPGMSNQKSEAPPAQQPGFLAKWYGTCYIYISAAGQIESFMCALF
jgi:hypothetical protein